MKLTKGFFFLFPLTILAISLRGNYVIAIDEDPSSSGLVTKVCEEVPFKDVCIKTLGSHPNSKQLDLMGLTSLSLKVAVETATNSSVFIGGLLEKTDDPFEEQCLSDCAENYLDATDQLEDSIAALDSKGYNDVSTWVQAAIADAETCEAGFKDQPGHRSLLTDRNSLFSRQCSNALAINKLLSES